MGYLGDYPLAGGLTADDRVLLLNDPAGTPAVQIVTAANAKTYLDTGGGGAAAYGTLVTGLATGSGAATANTAAIQAALNVADTAGGGRVVIPVGRYHINNTLTIGSRCILAGLGWGSILHLADGTSTTATPKPVVGAEGNSNYIGIEDLMIDGNAAGQVDTGYSSNGIDFYGRGTSESSSAPLYDGGLWCRNVMVYNCKGVGFYVRGDATTMRVTDCYAYHNEDAGFWLKTDCEIANCVAANNGGYGLRVYSGTSVRITSVKCFGNCWRYQGADFLIHYCNTVLMTDCMSEDSRQCGFVFTSVRHLTAIGVQAYRCMGGVPSDANQSAFWVEDDTAGNFCEYVTIIGDVLAGGGADQFNYALTTRTLGVNCEIRLKSEMQSVALHNNLSGAGLGLSNSVIEFNNDAAGASPSNTQTASYTLVLQDAGKTVVMNVAGANALTVPPNSSVAFPVGTVIGWEQYGAGLTTITAGAGVTLRSRGGLLASAGQYAAGSLRKIGTDEFVVSGDVA